MTSCVDDELVVVLVPGVVVKERGSRRLDLVLEVGRSGPDAETEVETHEGHHEREYQRILSKVGKCCTSHIDLIGRYC